MPWVSSKPDVSSLRRGATTSIRTRCQPTAADRSTANRAGSASIPRVICGTPSLHDRTRSNPASVGCLYGRSSRMNAHFLLGSACVNCATSAPPRRPHNGWTCPVEWRGTNVWYYCDDLRPGGVLRSRTTRGRPRRMLVIFRRGRPSTSLDVDGLVNGSRGPERLARGGMIIRGTLSMIMPSVDVHRGRRSMQ